MKKFIFTAVGIVMLNIASYAQNCNSPVSNIIFQSNFNQIAVQSSNQLKLNMAIQFVNNNCLMSAQVKNITLLFTDDAYKLEFCKVAYSHTFDKVSFYDVYDAFSTFSNAFRLHDYILLVETHSTNTATAQTTTASQATFPNIAYPAVINYSGHTGCQGPVINDNAFRTIAQNVANQPTDESKFVAVQLAYEQNCLGMGQMMKLCFLLQSEDMRLRSMMNAFPKIYDQDHYQSAVVLFANNNNQSTWTTYASAFLSPPPPPPAPEPVCETSDADFQGIMKSLKAKNFPDEKVSMLELISQKRCFSVSQIKTIGKEFSFGSDKLKVFKMLYAKCNTRDDYYQLVDMLTFPSEKEELSSFIRNDGK